MTLGSKLKKAAASMGASMIPKAPLSPKEDEAPAPDLRELDIPELDRRAIASLVEQSAALAAEEKEVKAHRKPITETLKRLVAKYGITKFVSGDVPVTYYNAPRATLSKELLLNHGVSPQIIVACTTVKDCYTLRIGGNGGREEE